MCRYKCLSVIVVLTHDSQGVKPKSVVCANIWPGCWSKSLVVQLVKFKISNLE